MTGQDFRPLTAEDAAWAAGELAGMEPWWSLGYAVGTLERYLTRDDPALGRWTVWCDDGRAGVVALRSPWLRGPCLELLAITRPGRGLGSAVIAWAAARAGNNLWTCVSDFNTGARAFYERNGFRPVAELPGLVVDGRSEILMRRISPAPAPGSG